MGVREAAVALLHVRWIWRFAFGCSLVVIMLSTSSCGPSSSQISSEKPESHNVANVPIPIGDLMAEHISFQFAVYYLPKPTDAPLEELDNLLNDKFTALQRVESIEEKPKRPTISARLEADPKSNYLLPDAESLRHFGRGLTQQQTDNLQKAGKVLVLDFAHPKESVWEGLRNAVKLVHSLSQSLDGLIWDDATREVFSPIEWEQRRIEGWDVDVPNISSHTVIHSYQKTEYVRAITLGMSKFGLPDIVIDQFSFSLRRNMGHVVNLLAQALAEGATVTKLGEFDLDFKNIKNSSVREPQMSNLMSNATGVARLSLRQGIWEEGDPLNRLIEITFDRGDGPDIHAKQEDIVSRAFGSQDAITRIQHDDELNEASRKAKEKLPLLRAEFTKGFAPGEFLLVKAPFATPDEGHEWMWVEVIKWKGDNIIGLLQNDPFNVRGLHAGQTVEVSEAKVFDYIRVHADGTSEGNETAKLIEKQSE